MRFATYLPYDWEKTTRCFVDYCSEHIGKDSVYCIPADTPEDFIAGSICIEPTCPELLLIFEVKHFYWIDKISHYNSLKTGAPSPVYSSRLETEMLSKRGDLFPYKQFIDNYKKLDKVRLEILVPKEEIIPIKIVDIRRIVETAFEEENVDLDEPKTSFVAEQLDDDEQEYKDVGDMPRARCLRNLEARFYFENFILNDTLINIANEIYGTNIIGENVDLEIFWKLKDKLNESPTEQRLAKLIKYFQNFIHYK